MAAREHELARRGWAALSGDRNICLLGPPPLGTALGAGSASINDDANRVEGAGGVQRLPIFSFLIRFDASASTTIASDSASASSNANANASGNASESLASSVTGAGRFLHYQFVCALLNDLFGAQARVVTDECQNSQYK